MKMRQLMEEERRQKDRLQIENMQQLWPQSYDKKVEYGRMK